jgi:hypothetical protein
MNISTIEQYVDQANKWGAIFGNRPLSLLNKADRQIIANRLDSDLSPENLTCDGELRGAQVTQKLRYLTRCAEELLSIDPSVTFSEMGV